MQKFSEKNCTGTGDNIYIFFEGDEDEIDDTICEYKSDDKSDDDDKIDSTEDEGNDDDTTGTGRKIIYIYINVATANGHVLKNSRL